MRRRLLILALVAAAAGCGTDKTLGPVQTIDGQWSATQNGYALSLNVLQAGTSVTGGATLGSVALTATGTVSGTFVYPDVHLTLDFPGYLPVDYIGTMSTTEAKIFGKLNGSGLSNVEIDVKKK